eukprot:389715-Prorocentrum_minimum.AAC.1
MLNWRRFSGEYSSMQSRHSRALASHSSSPYSKYHWSVRATTHSSPDRDITCKGGEFTAQGGSLISRTASNTGLSAPPRTRRPTGTSPAKGVNSSLGGVVWSSEDAHGPQHRLLRG